MEVSQEYHKLTLMADDIREAQPFSRKELDEERAKKEYEVSFLVREEGGSEAVRNLITRHGGEIINASPMRRIALAYKIEKETHAYFGFFRVSFSPSTLPIFTNDLETGGQTLRFLVIIPPHVRARKNEPKEPVTEPQKPPRISINTLPLSNEALERKIEEILQ